MTDNEEWVVVRGVNIPRSQLAEIEQNGGELVPDFEAILIAALDRELKKIRTKTGKYPRGLVLRDDPFTTYVPIPLLIKDPVTKTPIRVPHKPAWIRTKRIFALGGLDAKTKTQ